MSNKPLQRTHTDTATMAAEYGPIMYSNFNAQLVSFDKLSKTKRGSKTVKINYGSSKSVLLQTPPVRLPYGLSIFNEEEGGRDSVSLSLSLDTDDNKIVAFTNVLRNIDEAVLRHCTENSVEVFGRTLGAESVAAMYTSPIKDGRPNRDGGMWPATLRAKVSSIVAPHVFDVDRTEISWESVPGQYKGHVVRLILQLQPIWFVGKGFGVSYRVQQMCIVSVPPQQDRFMFIDDGDVSPIEEDVE